MTERIAQVYLLRLGDTDYFKVGMTTDINSRIAALQTAIPFDLHLIAISDHPNAFTVEKDMHAALKAYNVRNEWFQCEQQEIVKVFRIVSAMATVDRMLDDAALDREMAEVTIPQIPFRSPQPTSPVNYQIEAMLRQGYSYRQIERALSVSHATIAQISKALRAEVLDIPISEDLSNDPLVASTSATNDATA